MKRFIFSGLTMAGLVGHAAIAHAAPANSGTVPQAMNAVATNNNVDLQVQQLQAQVQSMQAQLQQLVNARRMHQQEVAAELQNLPVGG
jgi:peptidoglycan hydrolase CwlO-like protein